MNDYWLNVALVAALVLINGLLSGSAGSGGPVDSPGRVRAVLVRRRGAAGRRDRHSDVVVEMEDSDQSPSASHPVPRAAVRYGGNPKRAFAIAERRTEHVRHRHKYADVALPRERRFYFHCVDGQSIAPAGTMEEFGAALRRLTPQALEFHLERGDFSRWLERIINDRKLAVEVASWEDEMAAHRAAEVERVRQQLIRAVRDRYLDDRDALD